MFKVALCTKYHTFIMKFDHELEWNETFNLISLVIANAHMHYKFNKNKNKSYKISKEKVV